MAAVLEDPSLISSSALLAQSRGFFWPLWFSKFLCICRTLSTRYCFVYEEKLESTDLSICSLIGNVGSFAVKHEDDQIGRKESVAGRQGEHNLHLHLNPYRNA